MKTEEENMKMGLRWTVAGTRESQQRGTEGGNGKNALKGGNENVRKERG